MVVGLQLDAILPLREGVSTTAASGRIRHEEKEQQRTAPYLEMCRTKSAASLKRGRGTMADGAGGEGDACLAFAPQLGRAVVRESLLSAAQRRNSQSTNRTSRKESAWSGNVFERRERVISSQGHGEGSRSRRASRSDPAQRWCRLVRTPKLRRRSLVRPRRRTGRFAATRGGSDWSLRSGSTARASRARSPIRGGHHKRYKGISLLPARLGGGCRAQRPNPKWAESTQTASKQREAGTST